MVNVLLRVMPVNVISVHSTSISLIHIIKICSCIKSHLSHNLTHL